MVDETATDTADVSTDTVTDTTADTATTDTTAVNTATDTTTDTATDTSDTSDKTAEPFFSKLPDDWRAQAVAQLGLEDQAEVDKALKRMERYKDFATWTKASFDAHSQIRKGEVKTGLPENPTDEQLAEYRAANGIPETHEGYDLQLADGVTMSEADTRIFDSVKQAAHGLNIPSDQLSAISNAMLAGRQQELVRIQQQDGLNEQQSKELLRQEWGADFDANVNIGQAFMNRLPEEARASFEGARMSDGTMLLHSPEFANLMVQAERAINPTAAIVPVGENAVKTVTNRITEIEGIMANEPDKYWKDPKLQDELGRLYEAQSKMAA